MLARNMDKYIGLVDFLMKEHILSDDDLREWLASSWAEMEILEQSHDELLKLVRKYEIALSIYKTDQRNVTNRGRLKFLELLSERNNKVATALLEGIKIQKSATARERANALHNRPGGSRDKQAAIRKIWASGKYSSRDICAEQECAALDMSFSAARKALRNTPSPT